jgi:hypothetical protein
MYRQHKAKGGVLSAAGLHSTKPKKSSGGLLSAAGLEDSMQKLKIFKEHMASKPKAKGGLLSGAGMSVNVPDNEDSDKFFRQGTGIGF